MFSLTWFSLSGETLKIATMRGNGVTQLAEAAEINPTKKDDLYLLVSEAEISATPSKPKKEANSSAGSTMTQKAKPGTFVYTLDEQNGFFRFNPLPDQRFRAKRRVPSSESSYRAQVDLIILGNAGDTPKEQRPVTDEAYYALYKGIGSYCTIEFYIGLVTT